MAIRECENTEAAGLGEIGLALPVHACFVSTRTRIADKRREIGGARRSFSA